MKQLQKNIRRVAIALCALFALLVVWGVYSLTTYGSRWFASSARLQFYSWLGFYP